MQVGHRLFTAGLATLAFTLVGAVLLVLDVAVGRAFAVPATVGVAVVLLGLWFVLPLPAPAEGPRRRRRGPGPTAGRPGGRGASPTARGTAAAGSG